MVTSQGLKITVLAARLVDVGPHLFDPPDVRHFDRLHFGVKSIVNAIISGRFAHVSILLPIAIRRIDFSKRGVTEKLLCIRTCGGAADKQLLRRGANVRLSQQPEHRALVARVGCV
jgi:hypothetical protein